MMIRAPQGDISSDGWGTMICSSPACSDSTWGSSLISRTSSYEFTDLSGWDSDDNDLWMPDDFLADEDFDYPTKRRSLFIDEDTWWRLEELRRKPGWPEEKDDGEESAVEAAMWTFGGGSTWRPTRMYVPIEVSFDDVNYEAKARRIEEIPLSPKSTLCFAEKRASDGKCAD